jgi:hypothetical protein
MQRGAGAYPAYLCISLARSFIGGYCFDFSVMCIIYTVVGKLLLKSSDVTLLPLLVKKTIATFNPLPVFSVTVPL